MTTELAPNVHNLAVAGSTFDDCQAIVKAVFADEGASRSV
jgi:threonine synthase